MLKKLFRKSFVSISMVGIGTFLNAGLGFLFLSAVAKTLTVEDFGKYALLSTLLLSLSKLLDFGTNSIYVADVITSKHNRLTNNYVSNKLIQLLIAIPLSMIILFVFGFLNLQILTIFIVGIIFYAVFYTLYGLFQKDENYLKLILLSAIPAIIKGGFALLILFNFISWGFVAYFGVFSFSIGATLLLIFTLPNNSKPTFIDYSEFKNTLRRAFSPGLSQLITDGIPTVNNAIAKAFSGFADVGLFTLADKISNAFVLVSYSIFTVLLPKNAARKRDKAGYDYGETVTLSLGVVLLSFAAIAIARVFIPWFFENKYDDALSLLNMLVFAGALSAIHAFMENYFYVEDKVKYLGLISAGKILVLVILALLLVPTMQLRGLALANLIASGVAVAVISKFVFSDKKGDLKA